MRFHDGSNGGQMTNKKSNFFLVNNSKTVVKRLRHTSSHHIHPFKEIPVKKKKRNKNTKNNRMLCFIIVLVVGIMVSFFITVLWDMCQDLLELNGEYMVQALSSIVFGQELAIHIVVLTLQNHIKNLRADIYKPLFLSFHGSSGVGKTFLSSQILHFLPANTKILNYHPSIHYREETADVHDKVLSTWLNKHFSPCSWNILIIDDAQEVNEDVQKAFKKVFINMKSSWLYRKLIVIFMSNLYSNEINNVVFDKVKYQGQSNFYMSDFEPIFERGPSNWLVELYREGLMDNFVPFLPLDKNSVLKCIEEELKKYKKHPFKEIVNEISNEIVFYTLEGKGYQYSISGCKRVASKVIPFLNSV